MLFASTSLETARKSGMIWKTGNIYDFAQAAIRSTRATLSALAGTRVSSAGSRSLRCRTTIALAVLATVLVASDASAKPAQISIKRSMEFGTIAADATFPGFVTIDPVTAAAKIVNDLRRSQAD